jgi:hypothetical protein
VTCLVAQDISFLKAWGEVTADLLKRLGVNVDFAAVDWGTVIARRAQKSLRAARLLSAVSGLAQERDRHRQGTAAVLLGREQDGVICVGSSPSRETQRSPHTQGAGAP